MTNFHFDKILRRFKFKSYNVQYTTSEGAQLRKLGVGWYGEVAVEEGGRVYKPLQNLTSAMI